MEEFIVRCNALIAEQLEGISWTLLLLMMTAVFLLVHVAVLIWSRLRGEEMRPGKEILLMLLAGYACFLFQITFYNREEGSRSGIFTHISMWLKSGGRDLSNQMIYDLLNVCLFVPWGALIALFRGREKIGRKLFLTTCYSFLTSFCIEVIQLLTHRGYFELMDILTNVTGGILGSLAAVLLYVIVPAQGKARSNHG